MKPIKKIAYGKDVWCNEEMDNARRKECLCFNCRYLKVCASASELFGFCKDYDLAIMVTRCPNWEVIKESE